MEMSGFGKKIVGFIWRGVLGSERVDARCRARFTSKYNRFVGGLPLMALPYAPAPVVGVWNPKTKTTHSPAFALEAHRNPPPPGGKKERATGTAF